MSARQWVGRNTKSRSAGNTKFQTPSFARKLWRAGQTPEKLQIPSSKMGRWSGNDVKHGMDGIESSCLAGQGSVGGGCESGVIQTGGTPAEPAGEDACATRCAVMCGLCSIFWNFYFCARKCTQVHLGAQRCTFRRGLCGWVRLGDGFRECARGKTENEAEFFEDFAAGLVGDVLAGLLCWALNLGAQAKLSSVAHAGDIAWVFGEFGRTAERCRLLSRPVA